MSHQNGDHGRRDVNDDSDAEEENLVDDYKEQVQYDDENEDDMDGGGGYSGTQQDIHAQMQAAVTPLEYGANLEAKFASYDNYCSLFHYILNSDGPVELELPTVRVFRLQLPFYTEILTTPSTTGLGTSLTNSSINSTASAATGNALR